VNGKADASDLHDMDTQIMLGLAPAAARPGAQAALVIGYGSGVTAGVLADVPGMRRVRVVEIEPAVLAMDGFFRHVNGEALARPTVTAVVDDARSALQLEADTYDIIVSEPSNPWVAGVATLYTPEFLGIARGRLAPGGVFCQWIQMYRLPLPVVAGVVANVRAVFPHVEVWLGSGEDLMVLASDRPLAFDSAWLARLIGAGAPLAARAHEWLGVDEPSDLLGRFLLGPRGAAALAGRADLTHTDDRPRLEYVAARRFLDDSRNDTRIDALVALRDPAEARGSPALLVQALAADPGEPQTVPYMAALHAAQPREPRWAVAVGTAMLARGDTASADALLAAWPRHADALLARGLVALERDERERAGPLLGAALAAGGDSAQAHAALGVIAAREKRWSEAAAEAAAALRTARVTFRHPFPRGQLGEVLRRLTFEGPADTVRTLIAAAARHRPGWAALYELDALAALRLGDCDAAAGRLRELEQFGIQRPDAPVLIGQCREMGLMRK
jgi:SAM-dependent methyltransferase